MSNNSSSKCQLFQLHIDAYLDDELESARAAELQTHLRSCQSCHAELTYAEQLHRAVVDLPILDCSDQALEPVDRLFATKVYASAKNARSPGQLLSDFFVSLPGFVRYGVPVTAAVLLTIGLGNGYLDQQAEVELATQEVVVSGAEPAYSQAEIVQALQDLEIAIDYLGQISQRTNVMIEDRFLVRKLEESISASFRDMGIENSSDDVNNGPI